MAKGMFLMGCKAAACIEGMLRMIFSGGSMVILKVQRVYRERVRISTTQLRDFASAE
jgi:hypothetical protein